MDFLGLIVSKVAPFLIIGVLVITFLLNGIDPPKTIRGEKVIPPNIKVETFRPLDGKDEDGKDIEGTVTIKSLKADSIFNFNIVDGYLTLPKGTKGIDVVKDGDVAKIYDIRGPKPVLLWEIKHNKEEIWIDAGIDIGTYFGYIAGAQHTNTRPFDVGIKLSPVRLGFKYFSPDVLVSDQSIGLGLSFYPRPERYGKFFDHLGVGYGRVYNFKEDISRNLIYFTISTRF